MKTLFVTLGICLATAPAAAQNTTNPNQPYDPDPDTVVLYHMDEGAGSMAHDAGPAGLDAEIFGATWTPEGRFGAGLSFDGNDHLTLPISPLYAAEDLTLEVWVRLTGLGPLGAVLIDGWFDALNGGGRQLAIDAEGHAAAYGRVDLGPIFGATSTTVLPIGQWVHVAAVFEESAGRVRIVVGGTVESDQTMLAGARAHTFLTIGRELLYDQRFVTGTLDEVRVSSTARALEAVPVEPATWARIKSHWLEP